MAKACFGQLRLWALSRVLAGKGAAIHSVGPAVRVGLYPAIYPGTIGAGCGETRPIIVCHVWGRLCAVSTSDQDVTGQTMHLTQAGAIKVFTDVRSGRTIEQRPGLEGLLAYARDGDTVAVVCLDRLGRSLAELLATVALLKERGIGLVSLEEKIDTNSAAGEPVFHVFGAIAHFERLLIAERTKDGIATARVRGRRPGRQPLAADKITAALKLVQAGLSPTTAAKQLGLGRSTVYREIARANIEPSHSGVARRTHVGFASGGHGA